MSVSRGLESNDAYATWLDRSESVSCLACRGAVTNGNPQQMSGRDGKKNGKEKMMKIVGEDEKTVREGRGEEESDREM